MDNNMVDITPKIQLIALDLDGTLFDTEKRITEKNRETIKRAIEAGIVPVISSGRPYVGLPVAAMKEIGMQYAITANGAAVYKVPERELIYENCMDYSIVVELMEQFMDMHIYCDIFIDGDVWACEEKRCLIDELALSEPMREYIRTTRKFKPDFIGYLQETKMKVQKITIDFCSAEDGTLICHSEVAEMMKAYPNLATVSGGSNNLEITRADCTKGHGLLELSKYLGIDVHNTMAIGDSGNDMDIIRTAGIGVAMANSESEILEAADYITTSNQEDGVAYAIEHFYIVEEIFENDYGCEERSDEDRNKVGVKLCNVLGDLETLQIEDSYLYKEGIEEKALVCKTREGLLKRMQ